MMVDIESNGPIPGDYSMISLGAVVVGEQLDETFYGHIKPISGKIFLKHWQFRDIAGKKPYGLTIQNLFWSNRVNYKRQN